MMFIFRGKWYHGDVFQDSTYLTINEAAQMSGYHPNYLRKLLRRGDLAGRKWGITWAVERQSLMDYIERAKESGDERRGPKQ